MTKYRPLTDAPLQTADADPVRRLVALTHARRSGSGWIAHCPAHDDRTPSLSIARGDDDRALVRCWAGCRTADVLVALGLDWGDLFAGGRGRQAQRAATQQRTVRLRAAEPSRRDWPLLIERWRNAADAAVLSRLAKELGLGIEPMQRLGVGWAAAAELRRLGTTCWGAGCWTWPMRDASGTVIGVRLRTPTGYKYAVRQSRQGLFVPARLQPGARLLLPEGPTDTASLLELGLNAVGRPSGSGCERMAVALVRWLRLAQTVIVADADEAGRLGAKKLASALMPYIPEVRVIEPPGGDARDWIRSGATAAGVVQRIDAASVGKLTVSCRHREGVSRG